MRAAFLTVRRFISLLGSWHDVTCMFDTVKSAKLILRRAGFHIFARHGRIDATSLAPTSTSSISVFARDLGSFNAQRSSFHGDTTEVSILRQRLLLPPVYSHFRQSGPIESQQHDSANSERRKLHRMNAKHSHTATTTNTSLASKKSQKHRDSKVVVNERCWWGDCVFPRYALISVSTALYNALVLTTPHLHHVKIPKTRSA